MQNTDIDYTKYLGKKFETVVETRMFHKGTIIEIKSIDIRKFNNETCIRFRCIVNNDKNGDDSFLDASEFVSGIGTIIKEVQKEKPIRTWIDIKKDFENLQYDINVFGYEGISDDLHLIMDEIEDKFKKICEATPIEVKTKNGNLFY